MTVSTDKATHSTLTKVLKFDSQEAYDRAAAIGLVDRLMAEEIPPEKVEGVQELRKVEGNILLNEGINSGIWPLVCGGSATAFNNTNARVGVGDADPVTYPESATDTDLRGVNKAYKAQDTGYPTYGTSQKATWRSTFGTAEANFQWREWIVDNGATAGITLNRKCEELGTKTSAGVWVLEVAITLS